MYNNLNNVNYLLCQIYICLVFNANCVCVYSFCIVEPLIIEHVINVSISKTERNVCCCQFMRRCKVVHCYLKHFFQNVTEVLWICVSTWNTTRGAQSVRQELSRKKDEKSKIQKGRRGMYRAILATMGY